MATKKGKLSKQLKKRESKTGITAGSVSAAGSVIGAGIHTGAPKR